MLIETVSSSTARLQRALGAGFVALSEGRNIDRIIEPGKADTAK
jgi:hypothetical protein